MIIGYQINEGFIVVNTTKKVFHINPGNHPKYDEIKEALRLRDFDLALELIDIEDNIRKFGDGQLIVKDGVVTFKGRQVPYILEEYILRMIEEGFDVGPMVAFLTNLYQNPSKQSIQELFMFLEANAMPITDDGHFLAYKFVREDYTDWYSGKFLNTVGTEHKMERNEVDDDRNVTCSTGLHICSLPYVKSWLRENDSLRVMVVKINPADVVSVPYDYNNTKMRCCRYVVISELDRDQFDFTDPDFEGAFDTIVDREFNKVDDDDDDDYDEDVNSYDDEDYDDYLSDYEDEEEDDIDTDDKVPADSELDPYNLGLKHGTIAHNRASKFAPSAPRTDKGHFAPGYNEYMAGYRAGYEARKNFFKEYAKSQETEEWPSDDEIRNSYTHSIAMSILGAKHATIAKNRGITAIKVRNIAHPDDVNYRTYYYDVITGKNTFAQIIDSFKDYKLGG